MLGARAPDRSQALPALGPLLRLAATFCLLGGALAASARAGALGGRAGALGGRAGALEGPAPAPLEERAREDEASRAAEPWRAAAEERLARAAERHAIPALSACVVRAGEPLLDATLERAAEGQAPGLFRIGSISKLVTALLVLRELEAGRARLAQPLEELWPAVPAGWKRLTLEELLSHSSGLADFAAPGSAWWRKAHERRSPEAVLAEVAERALEFPPGRSWAYSNTGYLVLGRVLEHLRGEPFAEQVARLASELELGALGACWDEALDCPGPESALPPPSALRQVDSSAGLCGSALAVARLGDALASGRGLGTQSLALLATGARLADGRVLPNGLGLFVAEVRGRRAWFHSGAVHGYRSMLLVVPEARLSVAVLASAELVPVERLARELALLALGHEPGPEGDGAAPEELLASLHGRWRAGALELVVRPGRGGATAAIVGGPGALLAWEGERLFSAQLGAPSTLELAADGRALSLRQGARELVFVRAEPPEGAR